jgi:hypothetical protein
MVGWLKNDYDSLGETKDMNIESYQIDRIAQLWSIVEPMKISSVSSIRGCSYYITN